MQRMLKEKSKVYRFNKRGVNILTKVDTAFKKAYIPILKKYENHVATKEKAKETYRKLKNPIGYINIDDH